MVQLLVCLPDWKVYTGLEVFCSTDSHFLWLGDGSYIQAAQSLPQV